ENHAAGADSSPTPTPEAADQATPPSNFKESEAGTALEPDLPQSAEIEQIAGEQSTIPRRVHYRVGLAVRQVYDDNINISQTDRKEDLYTTIEPTIDVGFGDLAGGGNFLELNYSPNGAI